MDLPDPTPELPPRPWRPWPEADTLEERQAWESLVGALLDFASEALAGTPWAVPEGDEDGPGLAVEAVLIVGWRQARLGSDAVTYLRTGTTWASKGLVRDALVQMADDDDPWPDVVAHDAGPYEP